MQTVQIGYGKINFPRKSMSLSGFVVEDGFKRVLVSKRYAKVGRTNVQPVSNTPDLDGYLYTDNVNVPDGTIICIQASSRVRGMSVADGAIFIRVREAGAGLLIRAKLPAGGLSTVHCVFSGHGDILAFDELAAEAITVPDNFAKGFMAVDEIDELFTVTEIVPARVAPPRLEVHISDSGKEVKLNVIKPARRMRIRK